MSNDNFNNRVTAPLGNATTWKSNVIKAYGLKRRCADLDYYPAFSFTNDGTNLVVTIEDPAPEPYYFFTHRISDGHGGEASGAFPEGSTQGAQITIDVSGLSAANYWRIVTSTAKKTGIEETSYFDFWIDLNPVITSGGVDTGDSLARLAVEINGALFSNGQVLNLGSVAVGAPLTKGVKIENKGLVNDDSFNTVIINRSALGLTDDKPNTFTVAKGADVTATITADTSAAGSYSSIYQIQDANGITNFSFLVTWTVTP